MYGLAAPFNISLIPLALCAAVIVLTWQENTGDVSSTGDHTTFREAIV